MDRFKIPRNTAACVLTFTPIVAVLASSPVYAQAYDRTAATGNVLPVVLDARGDRHLCAYGYYGPLTPPISQNGESLVCINDHHNFYVAGVHSGPVKSAKKKVSVR
jgi:hypothetical protein